MRPDCIAQRILDLLADGKKRAGKEIAQTIAERHGKSELAVIAELSYVARFRQVTRVKDGRCYVYFRNDVPIAA